MAKTFTRTVNEGSACRIKFTLKDFDGAAIPNTNVNTATLDLRLRDGTVINNRTNVNVLSNIDANGLFSFTFVGADMDIQSTDDNIVSEVHIATVSCNVTISSVTYDHVENFWIKVLNLRNE